MSLGRGGRRATVSTKHISWTQKSLHRLLQINNVEISRTWEWFRFVGTLDFFLKPTKTREWNDSECKNHLESIELLLMVQKSRRITSWYCIFFIYDGSHTYIPGGWPWDFWLPSTVSSAILPKPRWGLNKQVHLRPKTSSVLLGWLSTGLVCFWRFFSRDQKMFGSPRFWWQLVQKFWHLY